MVHITKSDSSQLPVGSCLPLHLLIKRVNGINHYIGAGLNSTYADKFSIVSIDYMIDIPTNSKLLTIAGNLKLDGTEQADDFISNVVAASKLGILNETLTNYLEQHCSIGASYDSILACYSDLTDDIREHSDTVHDEIVNCIRFLEEQINKYDTSRKQLNDISAQSKSLK